MENRDLYDDLLIKYLMDELNADEKDLVNTWLQSDAQNSKYFDELKTAWRLAGVRDLSEKINVSDEWLHFKTLRSNTGHADMANSEAERFDERDRSAMRRKSVYRMIAGVAVAASVLLAIVLGWKFFDAGKKENTIAIKPGMDSALVFVEHSAVNTSGKDKLIHMSDGSEIMLADQSSMTYQEPFSKKRDVHLSGKAYFKVAKGQPVSFNVRSKDLVTTALGTAFSVTAFEKTGSLSVKLYESKVVVKAYGTAAALMKEAIYLLPGQELLFDYTNGASVKNFLTKKKSAADVMASEGDTDSLEAPDKAAGSWYMFNNQSLEDVLSSLSALYNEKISYNKKDIGKIYFTGKYNKSDDLESILKRIGLINNLKIAKTDSGFVITR